jgi:hypothetical protein
MAASYPTTTRPFTTKTDDVDIIYASHVNDLQEEVVAIENEFPGGKAGLLAAVYPVGSNYMAAVATNPATLLGFGTWAAFGAGRVPVGYDAADADFNAAEKTGGAKTHVHDMASHTHTIAHTHNINHTHTYSGNVGASSESVNINYGNQDSAAKWNHGHTFSGTTSDVSAHSQGSNTASSGGPSAANTGSGSTLQPFITVFMWKRTA